jgi:hypothetical protein
MVYNLNFIYRPLWSLKYNYFMKNSILFTLIILFFNHVEGQTKKEGSVSKVIIGSDKNFTGEVKPMFNNNTNTSTTNLVEKDKGTTVIGHQSGGTGGNTCNCSISLFPVPAENEIAFSSPLVKIKSYTIYDFNENIKISCNISVTFEGIIDLSTLSSGSYVLKLETETGSFQSLNFIKN